MGVTEDELAEFRDRARQWLTEHTGAPVPPEDVATAKRFQAALHDAGFAGITWPAEYGGQGLGQREQLAFNDVAKAFDLPVAIFVVGLGMCGPTLVDLGTDQQRSRYLRPLVRGEEIWCQLFSEPGAGSDVASLQTKAVRDGDEWVLDGQKVWTTVAHLADYGAVLARTNPDVPKHSGLTMFIVDMHAPGVTVRPLKDMTGRAPFNEVFFEGVRLPADSVIGEVNGGWSAAVTMLSHERVSIGAAVVRRSDPLAYSVLAATARDRGVQGDPVIRQQLAELYARQRALQLFTARLRQEAHAGIAPGARGSVAKLVGALNQAYAVEVAGSVAGTDAIAWEAKNSAAAERAVGMNQAPAAAIAGGTSEVQRNIIGERILGLPKEPSVDRDVPFRELKVGTQR
ncbi:alkylation response protein AidB-like acyl-CoA dehydrogenase [Kibdelosporangium banguiense]|uniref:Alkylation response protein AidB-like acyl-CoA dehydrogenase n=1 Tax=Kibdelosporangium banguiense TaxID=1365924 RepID=A0ABS4TMS2_9PSEU|nr:acyl-CoA dehydrogenase family protein [Kibdelosporangium banguiense]MBP2325223.1 alkylation response protein AidB-like acyl-CoA dehydrogenase [Kibdelosporangium banguiense]